MRHAQVELGRRCSPLPRQRAAVAATHLAERPAHGQSRCDRDAQEVEQIGQLGLHPPTAGRGAPAKQRVGGEEPGKREGGHGDQRQPPGKRRGQRRAGEQGDDGGAALHGGDVGHVEAEGTARSVDAGRQVPGRQRRPEPSAEPGERGHRSGAPRAPDAPPRCGEGGQLDQSRRRAAAGQRSEKRRRGHAFTRASRLMSNRAASWKATAQPPSQSVRGERRREPR